MQNQKRIWVCQSNLGSILTFSHQKIEKSVKIGHFSAFVR